MVDSVTEDHQLNPSAARLLIFLIRKGEVWWRQERISESINLSVDQIQRYLKLFDETGRLQKIRVGLRRANRYRFPWHPAFAHGQEQPLRTSCGNVGNRTAPLAEESTVTRPPSMTSLRFPETASARLPINRKENEEKEQERALPEATTFAAPSKPSLVRNFRHRQICQTEIHCAPEEFDCLKQWLWKFITTDRNGIAIPPPEWAEGPPDDEITARIAAAGGWNLPEIIEGLRRLKNAGKEPEISYGFSSA
jgi:hypothetical protein